MHCISMPQADCESVSAFAVLAACFEHSRLATSESTDAAAAATAAATDAIDFVKKAAALSICIDFGIGYCLQTLLCPRYKC